MDYIENTRNYPGWHLTATADAAANIQNVPYLLSDSKYTCKITLAVSAPTEKVLAVPNNRNAPIFAPKKLIFELKKEDAHFWNLEANATTIVLCLELNRLKKLTQVIGNIPKGDGDYSIGGADPSQQIWMWWMSKSKAS